MTQTFKPLHDFVQIQIDLKDEHAKGGIVIPGFIKEKPSVAKVIAVGPGLHDFKSGKTIVPPVVPGDDIIILKHAMQEIDVGNRQKVLLIKAGDILGKFEG
jgi:chaperonin GroES